MFRLVLACSVFCFPGEREKEVKRFITVVLAGESGRVAKLMGSRALKLGERKNIDGV